jgi:Galactose oxidase, central domain
MSDDFDPILRRELLRLADAVPIRPTHSSEGKMTHSSTRVRTLLPASTIAVAGVGLLVVILALPYLQAGRSTAGSTSGAGSASASSTAIPSGSAPAGMAASFTESSTAIPSRSALVVMAGFTKVGDMAQGRNGATATLLADGRVLIVGGRQDAGYLSTAEIFDPQTASFRATGSLPGPLGGHTAALLRSGRVLIVGGFDGVHYQSKAFLYDPASGSFAATGSLHTARDSHCAVLLTDGRVLIAGGEGGDRSSAATLSSAETYDPATGVFSLVGSLPGTSPGVVATLLGDGRVLVVNRGLAGASPGPASAFLFDPKTGQFRSTGSMLAGWADSAVTLRDGRVLVTGETRNLPVGTLPVTSPSAEIYDPATGQFSMTGQPTFMGEIPTLLKDGRVLLLGGGAGWGDGHGDMAEFFDAALGKFTAVGTGFAANRPSVAELLDGRVLIAGGDGPSRGGDTPGPVLASAELFQP